jgi:hypothetical protein
MNVGSKRRLLVILTILVVFVTCQARGEEENQSCFDKRLSSPGGFTLERAELPSVLYGKSGRSEARSAPLALPAIGAAARGLKIADRADDSDSGDHFAKTASDSIGPFLIVGELALLSDGNAGKEEATQGAKAILATGVVTEALKRIVREKRPNSNSLTSFPSSHASVAFAMATVLAEYKPKCKWLAYGVASTIAWSRVETHDHRWYDVVAGAAIGHYVALHVGGKHVALSPKGVALQWQW